MYKDYRQVWKGTTYVEFTLDDVTDWAGVNAEDVDRELIRKYVWESLGEIGFEDIEYLCGWE